MILSIARFLCDSWAAYHFRYVGIISLLRPVSTVGVLIDIYGYWKWRKSLCCLFAKWQERGAAGLREGETERGPAVLGRWRAGRWSVVAWPRSTATLPVERRISRGVGSSIDRSRTIDQNRLYVARRLLWVARARFVVDSCVQSNHIALTTDEYASM